jgi:hypothetical protein
LAAVFENLVGLAMSFSPFDAHLSHTVSGYTIARVIIFALFEIGA